MSNENKKTLSTFSSKAAQVCDNRWAETLKQAKSSITKLNAIGLASGSLQRSLREAGWSLGGGQAGSQAGRLTITQMTRDGCSGKGGGRVVVGMF